MRNVGWTFRRWSACSSMPVFFDASCHRTWPPFRARFAWNERKRFNSDIGGKVRSVYFLHRPLVAVGVPLERSAPATCAVPDHRFTVLWPLSQSPVRLRGNLIPRWWFSVPTWRIRAAGLPCVFCPLITSQLRKQDLGYADSSHNTHALGWQIMGYKIPYRITSTYERR